MTQEQIQTRIDKMRFTYLGSEEEDLLKKILTALNDTAEVGGVTSVFTRTGDVVAQSNDYTWAQINKTVSSFADIATRSASDINSGTLANARLTVDVTLMGNTFNGPSELVLLDSVSRLPAVDGSLLTGIIPSQTSNAGKFLTTDGSVLSWATVSSGGGGIYPGSGTPFTTYAKGDLIYASDIDVLSRLSAGNEGYVLTVYNGLPAWQLSDGGTVYNLTRTISSDYNTATDIGSFTLDGGTSNFEIWITIPNFHMSKKYVFPCSINSTANVWQKVPANKTTIHWNGCDFALDINVNNSVASFRIRSIWPVNATPGTAYITIKRHGDPADTFVPSSTNAAMTTPTVVYSILTDQSVLGAFTADSGSVSGNLYASTLRVHGSAGTQSNYSLSSWGGQGVVVPGFFQTPTINGASTLNPEQPAIVLGRPGTTGAYDNFIEFNVSRFSNSGNSSHSRLGISCVESGNNENKGTQVICFQSDGRVGIGVGSAVPNVSSILEIVSTTKAFLPPRMALTDWNAIASKAEGLQGWNNTDHGQLWYDGTGTIGFRYNRTTSKFQGFDGTNWIDLN